MPSPAVLILDAADIAADIARGGGGHAEDVSDALRKKRETLEQRRVQVEQQIAEIEKFHKELTGKPAKEAARAALSWVDL